MILVDLVHHFTEEELQPHQILGDFEPVNRDGKIPLSSDSIRVRMTKEHYRKPHDAIKILQLRPTGIISRDRPKRIIASDNDFGLVAFDEDNERRVLSILFAEISDRSIGFQTPTPRIGHGPQPELEFSFQTNDDGQILFLVEKLKNALIEYDQTTSPTPSEEHIKGLPEIII